MNICPHIDVAESEHIAAILADPANYVWRAIDCETPGDWTPDLGLSYYTNPSLVRVPGVAWSGQASTLRHRFWDTACGQNDHTGMCYLGVLPYDAARQECPKAMAAQMRYVPGIQAAVAGRPIARNTSEEGQQ